MASNRLYPVITCINPDCQCEFFPHDARQIYCTKQCRVNFNNDKRKRENLERYMLARQLKANDKLLESIYKSGHYKEDKISEDFLQSEGINMQIGSWEENLLTKKPIRWYHAFGVELISNSPKIYTIHLRTKFPK